MGVRRFLITVLATGGLLWAALVVELTEFIQYSRNTLATNGRWVSSKPLMQMHLMGASHFPVTRNALHGNRLNLGEWHGFNEVHLAEPVQPATIDYRFRLEPGAYIDFIFERDESGHGGIRLSRLERFSSCFYRADRASRYLEKTPLDVSPERLGDGWHRLRLSFGSKEILGYLDGVLLGASSSAADGARFIGLRAGRRPATLAAVHVTGQRGETLLDESFRNRRQYGKIAAATVAISLVPVILAAVPFLSRRSGPRARSAAFGWLMSLGVALALLSTVFVFDYAFWSSRYVYGGFLPEGGHPLAAAVSVESLRSRIFRVEAGPWGLSTRKAFRIPEALRRSITRWDGVPLSGKGGIARFVEPALEPVLLDDRDFAGLREKTGRTLRVGFLGTSQTHGSGAETISDSLVAGTHVRLAAVLRDTALEFYGFSIPGAKSGELTDRFMEYWRLSRPDLLIVNLSNNDSDAKVLTGNLRVLALEMKREGGEIVFVLEANTIERDGQHLLAKHDAVRKLGGELGVPVWDLHGYLSADGICDSGVLWWDEVHLTSYGQRLTAEWLADRLLPLLLTKLKSPMGPARR